MLRDLGCDVAQGFHLCRPQDAAALHRWMRAPGIASAPARLVSVGSGGHPVGHATPGLVRVPGAA